MLTRCKNYGVNVTPDKNRSHKLKTSLSWVLFYKKISLILMLSLRKKITKKKLKNRHWLGIDSMNTIVHCEYLYAPCMNTSVFIPVVVADPEGAIEGSIMSPNAKTHDCLKKSCESCCHCDSVCWRWQWLNLFWPLPNPFPNGEGNIPSPKQTPSLFWRLWHLYYCTFDARLGPLNPNPRSAP